MVYLVSQIVSGYDSVIMSTSKYKIESGVQLLARLSKKAEIENFHSILFNPGLKHGDTVEIISNNARTSYLLTDFICEALLPTNPNEEPVGVLMFNTVGLFNYEECIKTLQKRIYAGMEKNSDGKKQMTDMDKLLARALNNFYLLEIYDATQLYTTIHNLDNIFTKHSNISLLIFDTLTAFYWSEQGFKITKMDLYIKNLLGMIQKVSKEYKVILVYTRPRYFSSSKDTDKLEIGEVTDSANFKVQILDDRNGIYPVNVKTLDLNYVKYFNITDSSIKWQ